MKNLFKKRDNRKRWENLESRVKQSRLMIGNSYGTANKGKKYGTMSEEHKRKLSEAHKGLKPMLGKNHSEETKRKISLGNSGKIISEKTKRKMSESRSGEKSNFWKGGVTPLLNQIRHCFKYRQWRSDIFTRDNYTCVICGLRGVYLEADHYPKMFSTIFYEYKIKSLEEALNCEEFWNLNNGRTVCKKHNPRGRTKKIQII